MKNEHSDEALILDQVKDLRKRTRSAIKSGNSSLTYSLALEYTKLVDNAFIHSLSNKRLSYELSLLKTESTTIPPKSKDDPLVQLKWLDNSIPKLEMLVRRLLPTDEKPKLELHPRVLAASGKLLQDGHYSEAVFGAFKALEEYVREKSGRNEYGEYLMSKVFNEDRPILKIKYSRSDTQ